MLLGKGDCQLAVLKGERAVCSAGGERETDSWLC